MRQASPARLGFLGPCLFSFENPDFGCWISLDFLWIPSSEWRLINGLRGIFAGSFFFGLFPAVRIAETRTTDLVRRRRRAAHKASLAKFLIFCKILSSKPPSAVSIKGSRLQTFDVCLLAALRASSGSRSFGDNVEPRCAHGPSHAPRACSPASKIQVRSAKAT
jgi:hypothetical protein